MGRWGPSLLIFILVRKYWQNNYKRRFHTRQASVFHELFVKDDLSQPLLLHWLGELHKGPRWMTRSERRRLQKWRDDGGRALLETISNWRRRWTRRLEEDFAKALKRQRLLWCNPSLWSLKLVSPHPPHTKYWMEKGFLKPNVQAVENISKHFRISIQMLSNASDFFDVTLVWSDYKDGGANEIKTSRKRGSSQVIFMLVRKCWQNNYKRRLLTSQASVFHRLLVKDDLSKHALAFTWWAPHGPKLDDKKGEEDNDTVDNIGRRRVRFLNE